MSFFLRSIVTVGGLLVCLLGMASAGRAGLSRFFTEEALASKQVNRANDAVRLEPADPEAFYIRGLLLSGSGDFEAAIESFKQAIRLRPQEGSSWLQLGLTYESQGDSTRALAAFREAVQLAPYYAEPRWYLGRNLVKSGRMEEGFAELRTAAQSEPAKLPATIDLAWGAYGGLAEKVLPAIRPQTDAARVTLASFFIKQNQMKEAVELLRTTSPRANFDRYRFMVGLIENHHYRDAADVWNTGTGSIKEGLIDDADFEQGRLSTEIGFTWQTLEDGTTSIAGDQKSPYTGSRSLGLLFNGATSSESEFVKQLVLSAPHSRYQLSFAARTEDLHSDGLLLVSVLDAGANGRVLGMSEPVKTGTADWRNYTVDFETAAQTEALYIIIQPQKCAARTCSFSGRTWFDTFSLRKL